ncbi:hypothetical protein ID853_17340 [Xenorhabdus sp. Vera]|uniref:hypothetical protein n=1 Tax=Xenorhabdus koppenhoeferi TaxID=351659 RepID=UPI0019CE173F|nr:hypothetical protein [Xenorhabdus sp. Vera]MBD2812595.1 hypothetical protein [Xenorhabdus sp. Vera]
MSKLQCKCGYVMVVRTMEEDFLYDFIPQKVLSELLEKWDDMGTDFNSDDFFDYYNQYRKDAYKCPSCGTILLQSNEDANQFERYNKENE